MNNKSIIPGQARKIPGFIKEPAILILAIMRCGAIPPGYQNGGEAIMGGWQAIAFDPESTSRESTKPHGCPVKAV